MAKTNKKPTVLLRWKRQPNERGLARVIQGPRGWDLYMGTERLGYVRVLYMGLSRQTNGWYYVTPARPGIEYRNSCGERGVPAETVRASLAKYITECMNAAHPEATYKVHARVPGVRRTEEG